MTQPQSARRIALEVIRAVRESDAYANLLLPVRLGRARLSDADAGLATELTYGTLRMQGYYDAVIAIAAGRDVSQIDPPILDVLRLASHQLLSMRVASHAAVDESVELAKTVGSRSAVGFTNGVLRTISRTDPDEWRERVLARARSGEEALALEYSHPLWVTRAIRQVLVAEGREDELEAALVADNVAPRVSLVALPGLSHRVELPGTPAQYSPIGVRLDGGDPLRVPAVREGRARVQDEGSQLAALALSRARPIAEGEVWLDMCAGPGGKAALLAVEAAAGGATLVPTNSSPRGRNSCARPWRWSCRRPRSASAMARRSAPSIPTRSTGFSSTPPAPASARSGADRRPDGASSPAMSRASVYSSPRCCVRRSPR